MMITIDSGLNMTDYIQVVGRRRGGGLCYLLYRKKSVGGKEPWRCSLSREAV